MIIEKSIIKGKVQAPKSKSYAHRLIIASFLSNKRVTIEGVETSNDILATLNALKSVGLEYNIRGTTLEVIPHELVKTAIIDAVESGSTFRFLLPVISALGLNAKFTGSKRLLDRPITELVTTLNENGAQIENLQVNGKLTSGEYTIDASISSQYITGLLFALPLLNGDSKIIIKGNIVSVDYINITLQVLKDFNIEIKKEDYGYFVKGNQKYISPSKIEVEGDYSNSAFLLALGVLGGQVEVDNLNKNSYQGDKAIVEVLRKFGGEIIETESGYIAKKSNLKAVELDCENIPDIVQIISVVASFSKGTTTLKNVSRLKIKEADRINSILYNLEKAKINARYESGNLIIVGAKPKASDFLGFNDHRTVMAQVVLGANVQGKSSITDSMAVNKSYPKFFEDFRKLGGKTSGDI